ncbi:hypothetical protein EAI_06656 [Harpegnathos saltator]|uniref:Uncharacterized protein n=1 Tax=Harpegnathos saltator TaxID=610380 RepID=E2BCX2_HARSA|nr:hypothetical protein EAI_06656 [Harpegnathos saltator]
MLRRTYAEVVGGSTSSDDRKGPPLLMGPTPAKVRKERAVVRTKRRRRVIKDTFSSSKDERRERREAAQRGERVYNDNLPEETPPPVYRPPFKEVQKALDVSLAAMGVSEYDRATGEAGEGCGGKKGEDIGQEGAEEEEEGEGQEGLAGDCGKRAGKAATSSKEKSKLDPIQEALHKALQGDPQKETTTQEQWLKTDVQAKGEVKPASPSTRVEDTEMEIPLTPSDELVERMMEESISWRVKRKRGTTDEVAPPAWEQEEGNSSPVDTTKKVGILRASESAKASDEEGTIIAETTSEGDTASEFTPDLPSGGMVRSEGLT